MTTEVDSLQSLCTKKIAGLVALHSECGAAPGIIEALEFIPDAVAHRIGVLLFRTGHATEAALSRLLRPGLAELDMSSAAPSIVEARRDDPLQQPQPPPPPLAASIPRLLRPCAASLTSLNLTDARAIVDDATVRAIVAPWSSLSSGSSGAAASFWRGESAATAGVLRLETLRLAGLPTLSDATVAAALVAHADSLTHLDLSRCCYEWGGGVTDLGLLALSGPAAQRCGLKKLSLCRLDGITMLSLKCLAGTARPSDFAYDFLSDDSDSNEQGRDEDEDDGDGDGDAADQGGGSGSPGAVGRTRASLEELNLKCCYNIDDLPRECVFPRLAKLNAKGLSRVESAAWAHFLRRGRGGDSSGSGSSGGSGGSGSGSSSSSSSRRRRRRRMTTTKTEGRVEAAASTSEVAPEALWPLKELKLGECRIDRSAADFLLLQHHHHHQSTSHPQPTAQQQLTTLPATTHQPSSSSSSWSTPPPLLALSALDLSWVETLAGGVSLALACAAGTHLTSLKLRCVDLDEGGEGEGPGEKDGDGHQSGGSGGGGGGGGDGDHVDGDHAKAPPPSLSESAGGRASGGGIGGEPLIRLAECCPRLTKLNLCRCGDSLATAAALAALGTCCRSLTDVDLSWTNVCDRGLTALLLPPPPPPPPAPPLPPASASGGGGGGSGEGEGQGSGGSGGGSAIEMLALQGCKALTTAVVPVVVAASGSGEESPEDHGSDPLMRGAAGQLRWVDFSWVNAMDEDLVKEMVRRSERLAVVDYYGELVEGKLSHLHFKKGRS